MAGEGMMRARDSVNKRRRSGMKRCCLDMASKLKVRIRLLGILELGKVNVEYRVVSMSGRFEWMLRIFNV